MKWSRAGELLELLQEASAVHSEWFDEPDEKCPSCGAVQSLSLPDFLDLLKYYVGQPDHSDPNDPNYMDRAVKIDDDTPVRWVGPPIETDEEEDE